MIQYIEITNYMGETLNIDIFNPSLSGFNIRKIDGLGPVKADITTTKMVVSDGDIYNSARANGRNIVLTLGFQITPEIGLKTIEDCRQKTYKYFPLKKRLKFTIMTDNRELYTYGYVESNEPDIFSDDETAQISIICPESYFISSNNNTKIMSNVKPLFKLPFEVREEDGVPVNIINDLTVVQDFINGDNYYNGNYQTHLFKNITKYGILEGITYNDLMKKTYKEIKTYERG